MIPVIKPQVLSYHPEMGGNILHVEKGWCHYSHEGTKDFLDFITGYRPEKDGISFEVSTFRGKNALVRISFASETVFRFQMFPGCSLPETVNAVFDFPTVEIVDVEEEELFFHVKTPRLKLTFRKCPWEMTVELDGEILTREQIKDHNVDQKYKSIPVGFTVDNEGKVINAFETMYLYSDESFWGFGEKFNSFNKRGQKVTVWQRDAQSTNSDVSYKGMPYFMSSTGYSVLLNTFTRTHFNMGATSGVSFADSMFESVSALATVGLTAGVTGRLGIAAQILMIIYMYFGRVGVLTLSLGFLMGNRAEERFRYAQTNLLIG